MSGNEKGTENKEKKVVTKYDLKMQRRAEQKRRDERNKKIGKCVGILIIVAIVCFIASFPIRTYKTIHETFVQIDGEDITRVEFDYNYAVAKSNYLNEYGTYMSYYGIDTSSPEFEDQMYDDTITWREYFEELTVENICDTKALKKEAEAAGFEYDTTDEYDKFVDQAKLTAENNDMSLGSYIKASFGDYATMSRIAPYVKEGMLTSAYYKQVSEDLTPSEDDVNSYYNDNKDDYDSVDYYLNIIAADIPTEPTELADEGAEVDEDGNYTASDAEIEKAMADAKVLADEAVLTVMTDGDFNENSQYSDASSYIRDWLFDSSRKNGDTEIIEDEYNNRYFVVGFDKRYLDNTASADVRIIMVDKGTGDSVIEEWKAGEATEESFAALADEKNVGTSITAEGGLYEGVTKSGTAEEVAAWLFDQKHTAGEVKAIDIESAEYAFVIYYVGENHPEWYLSASDSILSEKLSEYMDEISAGITVEDPKGNLAYLTAYDEDEDTVSGSDATVSDSDAE